MQQVSNTDAAAAGAAESIETLKATSSEASGSDHAYTQQAVTAPEASGSGAGAPVGAEGAEEEDDDDEQYETDEEAQPLFSKRGTLFYEDSDQSWKVRLWGRGVDVALSFHKKSTLAGAPQKKSCRTR